MRRMRVLYSQRYLVVGLGLPLTVAVRVSRVGSGPFSHLARTREWPNPNPNPKKHSRGSSPEAHLTRMVFRVRV